MKAVVTLLLFSLSMGQAFAQESQVIRDAWLKLPQTQHQCPGVPDYFPNGGMRNFYCHAKELLSYQQLLELIALKPFVSGPHNDGGLDLNNKTRFGHYNPEFVRRLSEILLPAADDSAFREQTQEIFDAYVRELARTYYMVHVHLFSDPNFVEAEKALYLKLMQNDQLPGFYADKYFDFAGLGQRQNYGFNGNIVKNAVLFWLRRSLDGSEKAFYDGLEKLLSLYDEGFLQETRCNLSTDPNVLLMCAERAYSEADAELNRVYKELIGRLLDNQEQKLREAQRQWISFRDANSALLAEFYRASGDAQIALLDAKTNATLHRSNELRALLLELPK